MSRIKEWREQERAERRANKEPVALTASSLRRFGEAYLCQWPDAECNAQRHMGTGFCAAHIEPMRERASREIRESYGMCYAEDAV